MSAKRTNVGIVGGGLAGLVAAVQLARAGHPVTVYERAQRLGGRAQTERREGFHLNLGPHALYRGLAAERGLTALGIAVPRRRVGASGACALDQGRISPLPAGLVSLLTTDALDLSGKLELARFMGRLRTLDPRRLANKSAADWIDGAVKDPQLSRLLWMLIRTATYTHAPDLLCAELAAQQLASAAFAGVSYVHGGWQSIVDALTTAALNAGATLRASAPVQAVAQRGDRVSGVVVQGRTEPHDAVLLATAPKVAARISGARQLARFAQTAIPVRAATLDLALTARRRPKVKFVGCLDRPVYFSVHSDTADVAPTDRTLVHLARYLAPGEETAPEALEAELRAVMSQVQPGWEDDLIFDRFLPRLPVSHAMVTAAAGLSSRPDPVSPDCAGLFVAGDWVGSEGFLADAAVSSAMAAARAIEETALESVAA